MVDDGPESAVKDLTKTMGGAPDSLGPHVSRPHEVVDYTPRPATQSTPVNPDSRRKIRTRDRYPLGPLICLSFRSRFLRCQLSLSLVIHGETVYSN